MPSLDFKGKQFVYAHHLSVPFKQLDINKKKSHPKDAKPSLEDNLIINGDNLHALKALLPKYAGKIKCIYNSFERTVKPYGKLGKWQQSIKIFGKESVSF